MKFNVIIGNPPYQSNTGANGGQAKPLYNLFIENAKKINPDFLTMIIPARWYTGGMGLKNFRDNMTKDCRLKKIVDFIDAKDCFPNVEIKGGVCYFLWDSKKTDKESKVVNYINNSFQSSIRDISEFGTFIRHNNAVSILKKIKKDSNKFLDEKVFPISPFGLPTNFKIFSQNKKDITIYANKKIEKVNINLINKNIEIVNKYKVLISEAYGAGETVPHQIIGKPFIAEPNSVCTATYIICSVFDNTSDALNFKKYLTTKFVRFLIGLKKNSQHTNSSSFEFVPIVDFDRIWTDNDLYKKYRLTEKEINYIESTIKKME